MEKALLNPMKGLETEEQAALLLAQRELRQLRDTIQILRLELEREPPGCPARYADFASKPLRTLTGGSPQTRGEGLFRRHGDEVSGCRSHEQTDHANGKCMDHSTVSVWRHHQ